MLSDDPYGTTEPVPVLQPAARRARPRHRPARRDARRNINAQLDAFLAGSTPGHLHPATALTTGYDFLSDGATAVSTALGAAAAGTANKTAINDTLDEEHADRRRRAAAPVERGGGARHRLAERARRSQPLQARRRHRPVQRLRGGRGDADVRRPARVQHGLPRRPQRLRRVRRRRTTSTGRSCSRRRARRRTSRNTGFGYGDSTTIAYSEDLNRRFAQGRGRRADQPDGRRPDRRRGADGREAGLQGRPRHRRRLRREGDGRADALRPADVPHRRQRHRAAAGRREPGRGSGAALHGARTQPHAAPLAAPASSFPTDPSTGLHVESFTADRTLRPGRSSRRSRGSYYTGTDGLHRRALPPDRAEGDQADHDREGARRAADRAELAGRDREPFDPVYARPIVDSAGDRARGRRSTTSPSRASCSR